MADELRDAIRQGIADQVYETEGWHTFIKVQHIEDVKFLPGMAQIEVRYYDHQTDEDATTTIDALPVFTALLRQLVGVVQP